METKTKLKGEWILDSSGGKKHDTKLRLFVLFDLLLRSLFHLSADLYFE